MTDHAAYHAGVDRGTHSGMNGAAPPMGFGQAIGNCLSKYATFRGRASRSEYWWFWLFSILAMLGASVADAAVLGQPAEQGGLLYFITVVALFLPSLAVAVRRLHDTNRSGWWLLLSFVPLVGIIVLIVFYCLRGTPGPNRFG